MAREILRIKVLKVERDIKGSFSLKFPFYRSVKLNLKDAVIHLVTQPIVIQPVVTPRQKPQVSIPQPSVFCFGLVHLELAYLTTMATMALSL